MSWNFGWVRRRNGESCRKPVRRPLRKPASPNRRWPPRACLDLEALPFHIHHFSQTRPLTGQVPAIYLVQRLRLYPFPCYSGAIPNREAPPPGKPSRVGHLASLFGASTFDSIATPTSVEATPDPRPTILLPCPSIWNRLSLGSSVCAQ